MTLAQHQERSQGRHLVEPTTCDHDHLGRVLAMRHRVGVGHLYDVRERFKARIRRLSHD